MGYSARAIPGTTVAGVTRGGGSEVIQWVRNGPLYLTRRIDVVQAGMPLQGTNVIFCPTPSLLSSNALSDNTVRNMGDSAIGMSRPASPSVNLLTSAGELISDGVPSAPDLIRWRKALSSFRKLTKGAASDYVAWNFGWKPLETEIRTYYKRVVEADRILGSALKASANHTIKVGHSYPIASESSATNGNIVVYRWKDGFTFGNQGKGGTWKQNLRRVWFEGKYLYFPPVPMAARNESRNFADFAKHVLGLQLTPEVLWNLSPWSWFSDWLTNTDVIMASVSDLLSDGMVPVQAFVMCHARREAEQASTSLTSWTPVRSSTVFETKTRFLSVPYLGFGGTGTLSTRQISILAALGIQR